MVQDDRLLIRHGGTDGRLVCHDLRREGDGTGQSREEFRTPEEYRRALLEGMEGDVPEEYRALKKRYYEELVLQ